MLLFAKGLKTLGPKWVGIENHLVTAKEGSRWGTEKETMDVLQQFYGFVNGFVQFLRKYFDFAKVSKKFAERNAFHTEKHIKVSKLFSKKFSKIVALELPRHIWIVDDTLLLILEHQGFSFLAKTMRIFLITLSIVHYSFFGSIYSQYLHKLFVVFV
jgi:hypothetical protein